MTFINISRKHLLLVCILVAAFLLRFYNIDTNPPGIHADEADSGYSAYSILKTGRDYYGNFLPFQITGFASNYRTPLSTYLTVPFVAVFGLNAISIRLPAVILGVLFVLLVFIAARLLFSEKVGLIAATLAAVNPWAVHISRAYADHILALDFFLAGFILFLISKKSLLKYIAAGILLSLSFFSYHAPKIFIPLFLPSLLMFGKSMYGVKKKYLYLFSLIVGLFFILVVASSLFGKGATELGVVSVVDPETAREIVNKERRVTTAPLYISSVFHNKYFVYSKEILRNMGHALSFNYLYLDGEGNLTASVGDRGLFFPIEIPIVFVGFFVLFNKSKKKGWLFVLWALVSVFPGAITKNEMYTYRNIFLLPALILVVSVGFESLIKSNKKVIVWSLIIGFVISFISYYFHYYYDYPIYSRTWWAAEQKDAIAYVIKNQSKYEHVYIQGGNDWPLLYAFYTKADPKLFQDSVAKLLIQNSNKSAKIGKVEFFNYKILSSDKPEVLFKNNSMIVLSGNVFKDTIPVKIIRSEEDWGTVFKIIEIK